MANKSWFLPQGRGCRQGPLVIVPVQVHEAKREARSKLIISVPRVCGSAVRRNRFRRIARAYIGPKQGRKDLWLRLLGQHRLDRCIRTEDWSGIFDKALGSLS